MNTIWSASTTEDAKYLGIIEFNVADEWQSFEVLATEDRLIFGGSTNVGFLESGYILREGFSVDETLQELVADLETYYRDGSQYTSQIVFNERM
jgi:hypothetical protein